MYRYACKLQYVDENGSFLGNHICVQKCIKNDKWVTVTQYQCVVINSIKNDIIFSDNLEKRVGVIIGNLLYDVSCEVDEMTMLSLSLQFNYDVDNFIEYEDGYFLLSNGIPICSTEKEFESFRSCIS